MNTFPFGTKLTTGGGVQIEIFFRTRIPVQNFIQDFRKPAELTQLSIIKFLIFQSQSRGGQDFSRGGRAPLGPPLATGLTQSKQEMYLTYKGMLLNNNFHIKQYVYKPCIEQ